jgi:hypothetical protein
MPRPVIPDIDGLSDVPFLTSDLLTVDEGEELLRDGRRARARDVSGDESGEAHARGVTRRDVPQRDAVCRVEPVFMR